MQFEWFDLAQTKRIYCGVLEVPMTVTPLGLALELQIVIGPNGTSALWLLEDGRALFRPKIGVA